MVLATIVLVSATPAAACSCIPDPFGRAFETGEFEFAGVVTAMSFGEPSILDRAEDKLRPVENEDNDPNPETRYSVWVLRVDQPVAGSPEIEPGATLRGYAPEQIQDGVAGGNCALGTSVGEQAGLVVYEFQGRPWTSGCSVGPAEDLAGGNRRRRHCYCWLDDPSAEARLICRFG